MQDNEKNQNEQNAECKCGCGCGCEKSVENNQETNETSNSELETLKAQLDDKSKKSEEYLAMLQRTTAEFDNFKKRTAREKESLYSEAICDVISAFLPVVDNIERAIKVCSKDSDNQSLHEGVEMVIRQVKEVMKNLDVEEIECMGKSFDPQLHNAVMHIDDENVAENIIVDEFQKGYLYKDKVIRHSMVKVAN